MFLTWLMKRWIWMSIYLNLKIKKLQRQNDRLKRDNKELVRMVDLLNHWLSDSETEIKYLEELFEERHQTIKELKMELEKWLINMKILRNGK